MQKGKENYEFTISAHTKVITIYGKGDYDYEEKIIIGALIL